MFVRELEREREGGLQESRACPRLEWDPPRLSVGPVSRSLYLIS